MCVSRNDEREVLEIMYTVSEPTGGRQEDANMKAGWIPGMNMRFLLQSQEWLLTNLHGYSSRNWGNAF